MKIKSMLFGSVLGIVSLACSVCTFTFDTSAVWEHIGCLGDLNGDRAVDAEDLNILNQHILGEKPLTQENGYFVDNGYIGIDGSDGFQAGEYLVTADINQDGIVDCFDLVLLRKNVLNNDGPWVWQWFEDERSDFIDAPINDVKKFLPSQGEADLVIFYVDFPDCRYEFTPTAEEIEEIAFGAEDTSDKNYPFDSMSAFYNRSSKGSMSLQGKAYRYTAKNNVSNYDGVSGRINLTMEIYQSLDEYVDFSVFDGNNDGFIDATLVSVPKAAGDDNWWPCAGPVDNDGFYIDGKKLGHLITSNSQINAIDDYLGFNSTVLHEMGHCMGLPDLYLYHGSDTEGMHGTAGSEMMDVDATTDFSGVSKLQLGWYRQHQIQVYDWSQDSQTFTLTNAQTDNGNVVIIPCGELNDRYHSEYMLIEYTTEDRNNSNAGWWQMMSSGIRVYHVDATLHDNGWWTSYKYASGSEFTNNDEGRRFIRVIDDRETDNMYRAGDVVDNNILGFNWYDEFGNQIIDPGVQITVGENNGDNYSITISKK